MIFLLKKHKIMVQALGGQCINLYIYANFYQSLYFSSSSQLKADNIYSTLGMEDCFHDGDAVLQSS